MEHQVEKLKEQEKERDFFCVVSDAFRIIARRSSIALGSAWAFAGALLVILVWVLTGPAFHFSDTWQLVINTATTVITFLMVFLIQNTQNRDTAAIQIKLDELIRVSVAHNALMDLEELEESELEQFRRKYQKLAAAARKKIKAGHLDIDSPDTE